MITDRDRRNVDRIGQTVFPAPFAPGIPAVLVFALSNTTSILAVAVLSTLFFGEKRTRDWYLMVILSLASIVLNR